MTIMNDVFVTSHLIEELDKAMNPNHIKASIDEEYKKIQENVKEKKKDKQKEDKKKKHDKKKRKKVEESEPEEEEYDELLSEEDDEESDLDGFIVKDEYEAIQIDDKPKSRFLDMDASVGKEEEEDEICEMKALSKIVLPDDMKDIFTKYIQLEAYQALDNEWKNKVTRKAFQSEMGNPTIETAKRMLECEKTINMLRDMVIGTLLKRMEIERSAHQKIRHVHFILLSDQGYKGFTHIEFERCTGESSKCAIDGTIVRKGFGWIITIHTVHKPKKILSVGPYWASFFCFWQQLHKQSTMIQNMVRRKFDDHVKMVNAHNKLTIEEKKKIKPPRIQREKVLEYTQDIYPGIVKGFMCSMAWFYKHFAETIEGKELLANIDTRWLNVVTEISMRECIEGK